MVSIWMKYTTFTKTAFLDCSEFLTATKKMVKKLLTTYSRNVIKLEGCEEDNWENWLAITGIILLKLTGWSRSEQRINAYQYNVIPSGKNEYVFTRYNPRTSLFKVFFEGINKTEALRCFIPDIFLTTVLIAAIQKNCCKQQNENHTTKNNTVKEIFFFLEIDVNKHRNKILGRVNTWDKNDI